MTYRELVSLFEDPPETANSVLTLVLEKIGLSNQEILHFKTNLLSLPKNQIAQVVELISQYQSGVPIQYLLQQAYFRGLSLRVNPSVLIPRPETEELIDLIVRDTKNHLIKHMLDIGTGSGNIAISLKKELPEANVYAMDISRNALDIARLNANTHEVDIHFMECDILSPSTESEVMFDVIVSNPPYIPHFRKESMSPRVYNHEPNIALFVDHEDPFIFYKRILDFASKYLHKKGVVYFEISQYEYLAEYKNWEINIKEDASGNKRFLEVRRNQE